MGEIEQGLLVLLGVEKGDDEAKAKRLMERVTTYRVFGDEDDEMNLNVKQVEGKVLVVSQFTLPADTKKGTRAGFSRGVLTLKMQSVFTIISLTNVNQYCQQNVADLQPT